MALTFCGKKRKWGHPCPMDTFLVFYCFTIRDEIETYVLAFLSERFGDVLLCNRD